MSAVGPANLGISTSIMMHLMLQTIHSPIPDKPYLRKALRDLRYEEVANTFGMFFVHDLDTTKWVIECIDEKDPVDCAKDFHIANNKRKALNRFDPKVLEPSKSNTVATKEYPFGETPAYPTWQHALLNSPVPSTLVKDWAMQEGFGNSLRDHAICLFIAFTTDLIHAINLDYVKGDYPNDFVSLEDAMAVWTVHSMDALLRNTEFVTSNFGLEGTIKGPRDKDPKHIDTFFPETDEDLEGSGWDAALRWGYLKTFFAFKSLMSKEVFDDLRNDLSRILTRLQCLPVAALPQGRSKGTLWKEGKQGFQIWVNPTFYRLKSLAVAKGAPRSRKMKGLKSTAEQKKDFSKRGEVKRSKFLRRATAVLVPQDNMLGSESSGEESLMPRNSKGRPREDAQRRRKDGHVDSTKEADGSQQNAQGDRTGRKSSKVANFITPQDESDFFEREEMREKERDRYPGGARMVQAKRRMGQDDDDGDELVDDGGSDGRPAPKRRRVKIREASDGRESDLQIREILKIHQKSQKKVDGRSGKSKNRRVPPPPRRKTDSVVVQEPENERKKRQLEARMMLSELETDEDG